MPDSEKPKGDPAIKPSDVEHTTLPSLLGLIWNEPAWQILPRAENSAGNSNVEVPTTVATNTEQTQVTDVVPPSVAPQTQVVETVVPFIEEPAAFIATTQTPERLPEVEARPKASKEIPAAPLKKTTDEPSIERETPKVTAHHADKPLPPSQQESVQQSRPVQQKPLDEIELSVTKGSAPEPPRPHSEERRKLQRSNESSEDQTSSEPGENPVTPEAWATPVETLTTSEAPRKDEPSTRERKSSPKELDAPAPVVATDRTAVAAASRDGDFRDREPRQTVNPEVPRESGPKATVQRDIETLIQPTSQHSETKSADRHEGVASVVVPHNTKTHSIESSPATESIPPDQGTQWTQIEKSNIVSQLVEKARSLRFDRSSEIVISLKPEALGRISMRASLVDHTMVATIAAESDKVRQLLQLELPAIQRSLQETGIVARVAVSEQADLNFGNNLSHGQPRFRQNDLLPFREELISQNPAATIEVADARYSAHSVHIIA